MKDGIPGMGDGIPGVEEGTAQPVKEEPAQDEDILTFEEFKQRRMKEALHQQEELKNSGKPTMIVILGNKLIHTTL